LSATALATLALFAGAPANAAEDPFTYGNPAFCAPTEPVEDFGLSTLPPVHEAPATGDLPFGPKTVSLLLFLAPVLPPGESTGFWLNSENYFGRTPLRWILRNRIRPVDAAGVPGSVTARGSTRVRMINAAREDKLFLQPPRAPGFYRYEIEIVEFDGKHLATYSRDLRVERRFWDARLGLSRQVFRPGDEVLSRVENFGTETISYGEVFGIQRYKDGSWAHVDSPRQGWLLWGGSAGPGLAGRCSALHLPRDFPPGQYRIVKEVEAPSRREGERRPIYLTAPFEVTSRGS
jgi:hypothetical protein